MPQLIDALTTRPPKILLLGQSGSGKTCIVGSLANAGYRCFLLDFDNGIEALGDQKVLAIDKRKNVFVKTFIDKISGPRGAASSMPVAFVNSLSVLERWVEYKDPKNPTAPDNLVELGNPYTWGEKDVLVIDSLTFMGQAALRWAMAASGHLGKNASIPDYGVAMDALEKVITMLTSDDVKCVVLVNTHLTHISRGQSESTLTYPAALGAKLPERLGRYFNSVLLVESSGSGTAVRRSLKTVSTAHVELKNPAPSKVPPEMQPDLAQYLAYLKETLQ